MRLDVLVDELVAGPIKPVKILEEEEGRLALPVHEFGLDVVALIGTLRYGEHRTVPEIHQELRRRDVAIAERSVTNLLDRYDELLAVTEAPPDGERVVSTTVSDGKSWRFWNVRDRPRRASRCAGSPVSGRPDGGAQVDIQGENLLDTSGVFFGAVPAASRPTTAARPFYGVIGGGSFTSSQKSPSCFTASTNFSNSTGFTT